MTARRKFYALHGFNVMDNGAGTTDRIRPYAERLGYEFIELDYGWRGLLGVWLTNARRARALAAEIESGSVVAGHSNGFAIAARAAAYGAPIDVLVGINPALDADYEFAEQVKEIHVFGTPSDIWTKIAAWIPFVAWGDLSNGYRGDDPRVSYHDMSTDERWPVRDHSSAFMVQDGRAWLPRMADIASRYHRRLGAAGSS